MANDGLSCVSTVAGWRFADKTSRSGNDSKSSRAKSVPAVGLFSRSEEHTSELQSRPHLVCRLLLEKKKNRRHARHAPEEVPALPGRPASHSGPFHPRVSPILARGKQRGHGVRHSELHTRRRKPAAS